MVISIKDLRKLSVVSIISFCAVLVSTLFINFYFDLQSIEVETLSLPAKAYYDAQVLIAKFVSLVSGGVLSLLAVLLLFFYIKQFIDDHKEELGILKALGYQNFELAKHFWIFSCSVFIGSLLGFASSFFFMKDFYDLRNQKGFLPTIEIHFHWQLFLAMVILPTFLFALLGIGYALIKLKQPSLYLLKRLELAQVKQKHRKTKANKLFLKELGAVHFYKRKLLIFFVVFAAFSFAAMMQLSLGMKDFIDGTIQVMMIGIGVLLSISILLLCLGTVVQENKASLAFMKAFGYSKKECCRVIFARYRVVAYLGFVLGTVYQYALMKILLKVIVKNVQGVPDYSFDVQLCLIAFLVFVILYELLLAYYVKTIEGLTLKEVMLAE
ncbi:FtsX-like permease family protein [Streptococcus sp. CCH8-C6]|uniref:FtsX-like permease family protein n=1 Tax=Streptococcus sp. CCH8-C6 TaxID=1768777 RepID=UPI000769A9A5|nr:FtsX-like permease family protein [Streptococcus sp. CCH8-C6]